jgi:hypothetical protein
MPVNMKPQRAWRDEGRQLMDLNPKIIREQQRPKCDCLNQHAIR